MRFFFVALALLLTAARANAELITIDLVPGSDDQLLTRDTETGLDWLKVTQTISMTYDDVRTGIWYQMGFRHANMRQVRALFLHAGTPDDGFDLTVTHPDETRALVRRLGATTESTQRESTLGFIATDLFGRQVTLSTHPIGQRFSALAGKLDYIAVPNVLLIGEGHFTQGQPFSDDAAPFLGSFLVRADNLPARSLFMHGDGATANPSALTIDDLTPTEAVSKYRDSAPVGFTAGNVWKEIGTWSAPSDLTYGKLAALNDLSVWVGPKNSDDQGTRFDLLVEVSRNDDLVTSALVRCIAGIQRSPGSALPVSVAFDSFTPAEFDGGTDVLKVRALTRIGTNPDDTKCPGHGSAGGLRLYFDAVDRAAQLGAAVP